MAILGPERKRTQVELSITDAKSLGVKPPVRDSGDTGGSASLILKTATGEVTLDEGVIVAHRHVHMTPEDAERFGVSDGDRVSVRVAGDRPPSSRGCSCGCRRGIDWRCTSTTTRPTLAAGAPGSGDG